MTLTGVADGVHAYTATATDAATNISPASAARTITVDTVRPLVSSTVPTAGASAIAVGANVTATFSEAMSAASLTNSSFSLATPSGGTAVPAVVTYDAATRVATLNPGSNLVAGVSYTATITTAATDLAGNTLLAAHTWAFTTATAPADTTAPDAPVISTPAADSYDRDGDLVIGGTAEAGSTVALFEGRPPGDHDRGRWRRLEHHPDRRRRRRPRLHRDRDRRRPQRAGLGGPDDHVDSVAPTYRAPSEPPERPRRGRRHVSATLSEALSRGQPDTRRFSLARPAARPCPPS